MLNTNIQNTKTRVELDEGNIGETQFDCCEAFLDSKTFKLLLILS